MHEIAGSGIRINWENPARREVYPVSLAIGRTSNVLVAALMALCLAWGTLPAQSQEQPKQDIPDAPSASRPFPGAPLPGPTSPNANPAPPPDQPLRRRIKHRPPVLWTNPFTRLGSLPSLIQGNDRASGRGYDRKTVPAAKSLYKIVTNVNQVLVPVMVKDDSGRLVNGLLSRDFSVFEDGKKQNLNFFTTDPFALSAAVILDTGMPDVALQKVNQTFSALEGAFSQFDEVSLYTYSTSVTKVTDFAAVGRQIDCGAGWSQDRYGRQ